MRPLAVAASFALMGLVSCAPSVPPGFARGGAPLAFAEADWVTSTGTAVALQPDGRVFADGGLLFVIDGAGRVYDSTGDPVALLLPDGNIAGTDDAHLGRIGVTNASPPGGTAAWLTLRPDGRVIHFDPDGERSSDGMWRGCRGPQFRTCTLVTQLVTLGRVATASDGRAFVGFGVGVGVGVSAFR